MVLPKYCYSLAAIHKTKNGTKALPMKMSMSNW